jgi:5' nucleotidase family
MDYTLAQYKSESFESMAHRETVIKLVTQFGYPSHLQSLPFNYEYMMRGLIIDKVHVTTHMWNPKTCCAALLCVVYCVLCCAVLCCALMLCCAPQYCNPKPYAQFVVILNPTPSLL